MSKEQEKRKDLLSITVTARIFHFDDSTTRQKKTHRHPFQNIRIRFTSFLVNDVSQLYANARSASCFFYACPVYRHASFPEY